METQGHGVGDQVEELATRAGDSRALELAARAGYAVNGLLHLVIAWLCLQLAMLRPTADADQSGAFATLAAHPLGAVALWIGVIGYAGLCLWQLIEVIIPGVYGDDWKSRVKDAAKAVVYGFLAVSCYTFASGSHQSGKSRTREATASLMSGTGGRLLVAIVGLGIVAIGAYHVVKGIKKKFLRDLERDPGDVAVATGRIGYCTRGAAFGVVGLLFVLAAVRNSTAQANGLDAALRFVLVQPFGRVLMLLLALGFAAFGVYLGFRARHARV